MGRLFNQSQVNIDTRKRRRIFRLLKKVQRIAAVVLAWMVGAAILYGIYTVVFLRPYFKVSDIKVVGELHMLTADDVIKESGIKVGDHLLRLPVGDVQRKLEKSDWIKEVAVHRKLPHMVWLYVKEYTPEAIVRTGGWRYTDRLGNLFKEVSFDNEKDFPVITGLEKFAAGGAGEKIKSKIVEILGVRNLYENSSFGEVYGLSEIHFDEGKGLSIITLNDPMELRLGFGPFFEKVERLELSYPVIRSRGGVIAYIDLNSEGKVVVKYGT